MEPKNPKDPREKSSAKPSLQEMLSGSIAREASVQRPPSARSPQHGDRSRDADTRLIERDMIEPNPSQPRRLFAPADLHALGESLRRDGQLQALVVRPHPSLAGRFQIVSGERRWRASAHEYGDIATLRATVRDLSDEETLRLALIENIQRTDLSPIEIARGLQSLRASSQPSTQVDKASKYPTPVPSTQVDEASDSGGTVASTQVDEAGDSSSSVASTQVDTNEALGRMVGFTRARVQQLLALLELPVATQRKLEEARLNEKHGRALLMLKGDASAQKKLLHHIERDGLSGNQALKRAESARKPRPPREPGAGQAQAHGSQALAAADVSGVPDVLGEHLLPALDLAQRAVQALAEAPKPSSTWVDGDAMRGAARSLHEAARLIREALGDAVE